jgi:fused signal recognition particle receptor
MPSSLLPYLIASLVALLAVVVATIVVIGQRRALPPKRPPEPLPAPPRIEPARLAPPEAAPLVAVPRGLKEGLEKTRSGFIARIGGLLGRKHIDADLIPELEEILFTSDIGARTAEKLLEGIRRDLSRDDLKSAATVWRAIRKESEGILRRAQENAPPLDVTRAHPFVLLTIGVNGVGKTTTIGKLAARLRQEGKRVLLAAGDTFRAAATEQLEVWGGRVGVEVVKGKEGADPSSVIYDAVKRAQANDIDVVIADTAGRLHTKVDLMQELQKVRRVVQKALPEAPHETLLVLDATNGQNAIAQATLFKQAMDITGIVLTKLDGTAKGGVILGISDELGVPVRFVGVGEKVEDLRPFDAAEFVSALYEEAESTA